MGVSKKGGEWYDLSDLEAVGTWNYTSPTFLDPDRRTDRKAWSETSSFWVEFTKQCPLFEHVDIDGMAIFGGAVQDLLIGQSPNDIDICFFHEGTPHESGIALKNRVERFVNDIYNFIIMNNKKKEELKKKKYGYDSDSDSEIPRAYDVEDILVTRFKSCYEIKLDRTLCKPIKISSHANIAALFKAADIPCTSICYFDGKILMDEKAKFALDSCVIEVDPTISHHTYGARLEEYFDKGYDIIVPDLNMDKLDRRNLAFNENEVLDLPKLTVVYSGINNNKIEVEHVLKTGHSTPGLISSLRVGGIIHQNIKNLVNDRWDEFVCFGEGEKFKSVFSKDVVITDRMITNCYQKIKKEVSSKTLNLGKIQQYFTCRSIDTIMRELVVDFASKGVSYNSKEFGSHVKTYFEQLTNEQIELARKKNQERRGTGHLDLITSVEEDEEEGSTCAKKDFYGEYSNCHITCRC